MTESADAMKMMADGFALLAKGFTAMVNQMKAAAVPAVAAKTATSNVDTRTVTLPEAARRLGLSRSTIDRLCGAGELKFVKDRRTGYRRITVEGINDYYRRKCAEAKKLNEAA